MKRSTLVAAMIALLATIAHGQTQLERFDRELERLYRETRIEPPDGVPVNQRLYFDYGAYASSYFITSDDLRQETHILRQQDLNAYASLNLDNIHEAFVRIRSSYRDWNSGDSYDGHGDDWVEPSLERGYYRLNIHSLLGAHAERDLNWKLSLKAGRQLVHWGSGLVLSQTLDGGTLDFATETFGVTGVAGVTVDSTNDFDSSRPAFDGDTRRGFYGAMAWYQLTPKHRPYVYGLVQRDDNDQDFAILATIPTHFHYDSWYVGVGSTGNFTDRLLYSAEAVFQGGESLSSPFTVNPAAGTATVVRQTEDDISAWAANATLDYLPGDDNHSRIYAEVILASGDDDRLTSSNTFGGNRTGTTDTAFNAFGFVNTGLAFGPRMSNLAILRGGASTFPFPDGGILQRLQVGTTVLVFSKLDDDAPIDEATSSDGYIGTEADLYVNWQLASDLFMALRYGVFFPGDAILGDDDERHFFLAAVTLGF